MDKHYYLISQLPMLEFDRPAEMSIGLFTEEAKKWLRFSDFVKLMHVYLFDTSHDDPGPALLKKFKKFEYEFRNDLALWRRAQAEGDEYKPDSFTPTILKDGNPLEIEKRLLQYRWDFLDEHEKDHHFDFEFLIIYYLKLQILDKLSLFDQERGMETFREISRVTA